MNKFKKILFSTALCSIATTSNAADIETNTARFQAINKITGQVQEIDVSINGLANFETFSILVRKCVTRSPEDTPENTAFVDVVDDYQTSNPVNIFKGWMFSSTPGINGVEHPIYDIWLLKCYNSNKKSPSLSEEQLALRDEIPMKRHEKIEQRINLSMSENDYVLPEKETKEEANNESSVSEISDDTQNNILQIKLSDTTSSETLKNTDEEPKDDNNFISEGEEPDIMGEPEEIVINEAAETSSSN